MCGIFGHLGPSDSAHLCIQGLKFLEYRGYDSAGIAGISAGQLIYHKEVGTLARLEETLKKNPISLELAIAHTRWATHGIATRDNAHPHFDEHHHVAAVHNGIIENYAPLKAMLQKTGVKFSTGTDSEVIAQLVSHFYRGNLLQSAQEALALLKGTWGIALIHKNHPDQIIAAARENTLAVAFDPEKGEAFVSSDAHSFQREGLTVHFLQKGDIALLSHDKIEIYNDMGHLVNRPGERFSGYSQLLSKNGYDHFLIKEIFEQPHTIQQAIHNRMNLDQAIPFFEELSLTEETLRAVDQIQILACGTSWHAGCVATLLLTEKARIPTQAEIASEYRHHHPIITPNTLVIAISQSGETLDTLMAMREAKQKGAKILAICNVPHSTLAREADSLLHLKAGPEISVCSTKAFTSQIATLTLFALYLGRLRGHLSKEEGLSLWQELEILPQIVTAILAKSEKIQQVAKKYASYSHFFFLGRSHMYFAALEAALKLKEISYVFASGYPAGELKHGPIALLDENVPVIGLMGDPRTYDKMVNSLQEVKARRAPVIAFAPEGLEGIAGVADDVIELPVGSGVIGYSVACQLYAYYFALIKGTDVDQPRNLAKSVTVE